MATSIPAESWEHYRPGCRKLPAKPWCESMPVRCLKLFDSWSLRGRTWLAVGLILAVTLPEFLWGLGDCNIWIPLEARYALVAREMSEVGQWILPHLDGQVYPDKPPLLFWTIALISSLGSGVTEWTVRLPSAFAAIGVCLITWGMGARLFSPKAAIFSALVLATSGGFFWSGRQALPDMLLTLWTTGACWAIWEWVVSKRRAWAIVAGLCLGLATLTKGPVGVVLPILTALAYLTVRRHWRVLWDCDGLLCLGTFLGVTLAWFVPAIVQGGMAYAQATLWHHTLERYVRAWEHTAPWYFYLGAFPAEFLPWMLFLPQALIYGAHQHRSHTREGWWFTLCWLLAILTFFSMSTGKRDIYILPMFPAAALLVGSIWSCWCDSAPNGVAEWAMRLPATMLALGVLCMAAGIWMAVGGLVPTNSTLLLPHTPEMRFWMCLLLVTVGIFIGAAAIAMRPLLVYMSIIGCTWVAMLTVVLWVYTPQFNGRYPIKSFAAVINAAVPPHQPLQLCGPLNDLALGLNLGRFVPILPEIPAVIHYLGEGREAFCVVEAEAYQRLGEEAGRPFRIVARQEFDHSTLFLISNQR
jgi:4-amino-4-deoxy-L-arabinose transferase-like glycosyltransferase